LASRPGTGNDASRRSSLPEKAKDTEDQAVTRWINSLAGSNALLDSVMIMATEGGVPLLVALVAVQWWSRIDRAHIRHACIVAGLSFLIGLGLNQIILLFVHRLRPYDSGVSHLIIAKSADWSFPSDHATASIAIVGAFALQGLPGRTLLFGLLAFAVCWSRVFVGTHYVTDILGGGVTGMVAAMLVSGFYREGSRLDRFATGIL
jgi:undecaprenyl-diphosphatase